MTDTIDTALDELTGRVELDAQDDPNNTHRPPLSLWAGREQGEAIVVLSIGALWGQPHRYVELVPAKARELAEHLMRMAQEIERLADHEH